ncbi:MAG: DUF5671 domain-containing protein [Candidatus Paceibacterota bacterium]|jgi:hypothetical protein
MEQNIERPKASPKDVFLHLGSIVALYGSAISFLVLFFQLINIWIPDVVLNYYGSRGFESSARGAIAGLIVFFPMFVVSLRMLSNSYKSDELKRKIGIRRWLLYFTLFVTAFVMAGDLVSLIYNFLEGDLTLKFILKVCAVFFVAAVVFWYYLRELKDSSDKKMQLVGVVVSIIVAISVVVGVFSTGSPFKERLRKLDDQKTNDLMMIQNYIVEYWQSKGVLPESLLVLKDDLRNIIIPNDPETKAQYQYEIKDNETFALCAVFSQKTGNDRSLDSGPYFGGIYGNTTWNHDVGRFCFERKIDKDFFKINKNTVEMKPVQ